MAVVGLFDTEGAAKKMVKESAGALDTAVLTRYGQMSPAEVMALIVDGKWGASISLRVAGEVMRSMEALQDRIATLGARYDVTLGEVEERVGRLTAETSKYLSLMGLV